MREVRRALTGRSVRYGSNALVLSIAAIGIVVLLNVLAARHYKRFDATESRLHSLSPQSIQILEELDVEIEVIGFYPDGQDQEAFERWLDEYQAHSEILRYRTVDPIRQPGEAERLGWDVYGGGLLVRRGDRSQQVRIADEQDITSALLKVSREGPKSVYFLSGHNERSPTDYEGPGYGDIVTLLEYNNYQVHTLNLLVAEAVPSDAAAVVVAGPQTPLLEEEKERLRSYLLEGGKALILVDPGLETGINDVLEPWQVRIENKAVVDMWQSLSGDPLTPVIDRYTFSQVTKDLSNLLLALPLAAPVQLPSDVLYPPAPQGPTLYTALARTSERSWAETDVEGEQAQYDEGIDLPGPLTVIATVESPSSAVSREGVESGNVTRLVLIGDSDLASNDMLRQIPNGQFLLLNAVNWLAEEESLIAIGPKTRLPQYIRLSRIQEGAVCLGALILIPATIVAAGLVVWSKRR